MTRPGYYYDKVPTLYWLFFHTKTWWECNPPLLTYPVFALVFVFGFVWFFFVFLGGGGYTVQVEELMTQMGKE